MFEGKMPLAQVAHDFGQDFRGDPGDTGSLRAMTWNDLRSRLEAARDLRASLRASVEEHLASFDAGSARHIASLADCKHAVNPEDLANGKVDGCMEDPTTGGSISSGPRK